MSRAAKPPFTDWMLAAGRMEVSIYTCTIHSNLLQLTLDVFHTERNHSP